MDEEMTGIESCDYRLRNKVGVFVVACQIFSIADSCWKSESFPEETASF